MRGKSSKKEYDVQEIQTLKASKSLNLATLFPAGSDNIFRQNLYIRNRNRHRQANGH